MTSNIKATRQWPQRPPASKLILISFLIPMAAWHKRSQFVYKLLNDPETCRENLRDGNAYTIWPTAILWKELQIKLAISPSHSILIWADLPCTDTTMPGIWQRRLQHQFFNSLHNHVLICRHRHTVSTYAHCVLKWMSLFLVTRFESKKQSQYLCHYHRPPNSQFLCEQTNFRMCLFLFRCFVWEVLPHHP